MFVINVILIIDYRSQIAANSPIRVKKHVRCPGTRKLVHAFRKRGNCAVVFVDEYNTSRFCARCIQRFAPATLAHKFKACTNCHPKTDEMPLPNVIVTKKSKRELQASRAIMKEWREMADQGDFIAAALVGPNRGRLVSKEQRFYKNWQPNAAEGAEEVDAANVEPQPVLKSVWQRDIVAAKLILYKGLN